MFRVQSGSKRQGGYEFDYGTSRNRAANADSGKGAFVKIPTSMITVNPGKKIPSQTNPVISPCYQIHCSSSPSPRDAEDLYQEYLERHPATPLS